MSETTSPSVCPQRDAGVSQALLRACGCAPRRCWPSECSLCAVRIANTDPEVVAARARLVEAEEMEEAATLDLGRAMIRAIEKARSQA